MPPPPPLPPLQVHFHTNRIHFHMKGFARRLVLKQRHTVTGKFACSNTAGILVLRRCFCLMENGSAYCKPKLTC